MANHTDAFSVKATKRQAGHRNWPPQTLHVLQKLDLGLKLYGLQLFVCVAVVHTRKLYE